jgi:hypothetical protein
MKNEETFTVGGVAIRQLIWCLKMRAQTPRGLHTEHTEITSAMARLCIESTIADTNAERPLNLVLEWAATHTRIALRIRFPEDFASPRSAADRSGKSSEEAKQIT